MLIKKEKFNSEILAWYEINKRPLPWRRTRDPYKIWLSEVMLQQTQVKTVIPYYERFLDKIPNLEAMANCREEIFLKLWEGLGYYLRIRNFHKATGIIQNEYKGLVPDNHEMFIQLPGVGTYIAAAVMSIAFNQPYAVVDGNVKRVLSRIMGVDHPVNSSSSNKIYQNLADLIFDEKNPADYNQAIMELGATVCHPVSPKCNNCPVHNHCLVKKQDLITKYPVKKRKNTPPHIFMNAFVPAKKDIFWLRKREKKQLLNGMWEIFMVKTDDDEIKVENGTFIGKVKHIYSHFIEHINIYCIPSINHLKQNSLGIRSVTTSELGKYPISGSSNKVIDHVQSTYNKSTYDEKPMINEVADK